MEIRWNDPPPPPEPNRVWEPVVRTLASKPGTWAQIGGDMDKKEFARVYRMVKLKAREFGWQLETTSRAIPEGRRLWARVVSVIEQEVRFEDEGVIA